jgi:hypothetical protein
MRSRFDADVGKDGDKLVQGEPSLPLNSGYPARSKT